MEPSVAQGPYYSSIPTVYPRSVLNYDFRYFSPEKLTYLNLKKNSSVLLPSSTIKILGQSGGIAGNQLLKA